ncbi:DUF2284 domain-containing protein [Gordonibacter massiliensis (ex Traore et al. 2017)]|uniref:DUF2284 domain-containing protein n=1 Tax=Gordonibacter massiliensis (ex Traore et al. 2017) TaxID=1841863 RepID=A0A842JIR9_9ACTN|nr:DUF2284 domain-containing protein [Gordonibacter massiliensis (ex Traore et al. 2017)]MBC2888990.1 hypothetical protein [Gordonibacter massiliensis (ex Traore et al. 2017)]
MDSASLPHRIEMISSFVAIDEVTKKFVDVERFNALCKACRNFNAKWSCPPFDFEPLEYWAQYRQLEVTCAIVAFPPFDADKRPVAEIDAMKWAALAEAKRDLEDRLLEREREKPGSKALFPGSCSRCATPCKRALGRQCASPETLRFSIESLGGDVGLMQRELFGLDLVWANAGEIPLRYQLVGGLLS